MVVELCPLVCLPLFRGTKWIDEITKKNAAATTTKTHSPFDTLFRLVIFPQMVNVCVISLDGVRSFFSFSFFVHCGRAHTCAPTEMLGFNTL